MDIYSNAPYRQHFVGDFSLLYGAVHNLNLTSRTEWVMLDHNTRNSMPYTLRIVFVFFNVSQLFKGCETGLPAYSPYQRRLEVQLFADVITNAAPSTQLF